MATVALKLVPKVSLPGVRRMVNRLADWSEPLRDAVQFVRDSVRREYSGGFWLMPQGGSRPWKAKKPFGSQPAGQPGRRSGRLFRAWMGGPGGIAKVTPRTMSVGVDANAIPYAKYFRGGSGANLSLADMVIRPKKLARGGKRFAMFYALGLKFGVWLREATLRAGIRVSPRPHGTRNPELVKRVKARMVAYLKKAA